MSVVALKLKLADTAAGAAGANGWRRAVERSKPCRLHQQNRRSSSLARLRCAIATRHSASDRASWSC